MQANGSKAAMGTVHQSRGAKSWRRPSRTNNSRYLAALVALGLLVPSVGLLTDVRILRAEDAVVPVDASGKAAVKVRAAEPVVGAPKVEAAEKTITIAPPGTKATAATPVQASARQEVPVASPAGGGAVTPASASGQTAAPVPAAMPVAAPARTAEPVKVAEAPAVPPKVEKPAPAAPKVDASKTSVTGGPRTGTVTTAKAATTVPASPAVATKDDGKLYPVKNLVITYAAERKGQPSLDRVLNWPVTLGVTKDGYVAPRAGMPTATVRLGDIGKTGPAALYGSAFRPIYEAITKALNSQGLVGVFVVASPKDIDTRDNDIREGQADLHLLVYTSQIKQVRTVATSETAAGQRVDAPRNAMVRENSPLKPGDLLRKDVLDDYVLRLNRHPGRRVDVAVSGTESVGDVTLDYLIAEARPWYAYAQVSNTGTKQTNEWRERFGFIDNQLTGHDDILSLDYVTAGFEQSHAFVGSYELPVPGLDTVRNKFYGSWNEFTASDVGITKLRFTGDSYLIGDEAIVQLYQKKETFIDGVVGARFQASEVNNETLLGEGWANYIMPYVGLRGERRTDMFTSTADMTVTGGLTPTSGEHLDAMGRSDLTRDWVIVQAEATHSFYLEPLLMPQEFAAGRGQLAHELFFSARGQWACGYRLMPQAEQVIGGFYTVRGYPESIAAGDSMYVATGEYRYHIPRAFGVNPDPQTKLFGQPFRFAPQQPLARPDWDLIARAFVDVGRTFNSAHVTGEIDSTLVGAGVGLELQIKQNFNIRVDWAAALESIPDEVRGGSNRFHIAATLLY